MSIPGFRAEIAVGPTEGTYVGIGLPGVSFPLLTTQARRVLREGRGRRGRSPAVRRGLGGVLRQQAPEGPKPGGGGGGGQKWRPTGLYVALYPCKQAIFYTCTNGNGGACCMSGPSSDLSECDSRMCDWFHR